MKIDVTPVPAPRMVQSDRWRKRPAVLRYFEYKDKLVEAWGDNPLPEELHLEFVMPMSNSWSLKKKIRLDGEPHQQRPDVDNMIKAVMDSLSKEDSNIYYVEASKHWGIEGSVTIRPVRPPELL